VSTRAFDFRPWILAGFLRPVFFVLAIVAAVLAGDRSGSFWIGLLAFLVALRTGRVVRRVIRSRLPDAVYEAIWPAAAVGYAYLFTGPADLPKWASVILALVLAGPMRRLVAAVALPSRKGRAERWLGTFEEWGLPGADDIVPGRWARKD
jgi:hypothetical protein